MGELDGLRVGAAVGLEDGVTVGAGLIVGAWVAPQSKLHAQGHAMMRPITTLSSASTDTCLLIFIRLSVACQ